MSIDDYAIFVMVHLKDRKELYTRQKIRYKDAIKAVTAQLADELSL
jgi:hypothetical protein